MPYLPTTERDITYKHRLFIENVSSLMPVSFSFSRVRGGSHRKDLYTYFVGLDQNMIEIAINLGITRLIDLFISGAYGDVYGYWVYPRYFGYFSCSYSANVLNIQSWLSEETRLRVEMDKYNDDMYRILDNNGVIGVFRMEYLCYGKNLLRIRELFSKDLWASKVQELKSYKSNPLLDQDILLEIDMIVVPEIF